ncbi:MAG TPA: hypothetical protein VND99_00690 [Candidatus Acidoferrales bacterium]|nr:hypothetical protein [Candidatus Acidoferrales bacterium]
MSTKAFIWLFLSIGSIVGGYIPALFGASLLSFASLFWSTIGAFAGIWAGYKLGKRINGGI